MIFLDEKNIILVAMRYLQDKDLNGLEKLIKQAGKKLIDVIYAGATRFIPS